MNVVSRTVPSRRRIRWYIPLPRPQLRITALLRFRGARLAALFHEAQFCRRGTPSIRPTTFPGHAAHSTVPLVTIAAPTTLMILRSRSMDNQDTTLQDPQAIHDPRRFCNIDPDAFDYAIGRVENVGVDAADYCGEQEKQSVSEVRFGNGPTLGSDLSTQTSQRSPIMILVTTTPSVDGYTITNYQALSSAK